VCSPAGKHRKPLQETVVDPRQGSEHETRASEFVGRMKVPSLQVMKIDGLSIPSTRFAMRSASRAFSVSREFAERS